MNNEPVVWTTDKLDTNEWEEGDYQITVTKEKWSEKQIPLYTHPINTLTALEVMEQTHRNISEAHRRRKTNTLTDEEIESAWFKVFKSESGIGKNITSGVYEFARTILRKAQEK